MGSNFSERERKKSVVERSVHYTEPSASSPNKLFGPMSTKFLWTTNPLGPKSRNYLNYCMWTESTTSAWTQRGNSDRGADYAADDVVNRVQQEPRCSDKSERTWPPILRWMIREWIVRDRGTCASPRGGFSFVASTSLEMQTGTDRRFYSNSEPK